MTDARSARLLLGAAALSLACAGAGGPGGAAVATARPEPAVRQLRTVEAYVTPYYSSASAPADRPSVKVGARFDPLLSSTRREDVNAARELVEAAPELVTPMTMMVLSIRLYDVGLRDDAVFWYYAARERYRMLEAVLDLDTPEMGSVPDTMSSFMALVGPYMNGYLFCDPDAYVPLWTRAVDWTEAHPYGVLFLPRLRARPGDRAANLKAALAERRAELRQAAEFFGDPARRAELQRARKAKHVDEQFCWK